LIDEVQAGDRHLLARAKSAAGQPAEAAALLWQQLESAPPRYWGAEELRALGMLFEIAPDVEDGALRRGDLLEAWDLVSRARSGVAVPLPDGVGPLWVTSTRPSVLRLGPRSALARAGLRVGDRVLGISGVPVETPRDMADRLGDLEGAPVALLVERGIEPIVLPLTPEEG